MCHAIKFTLLYCIFIIISHTPLFTSDQSVFSFAPRCAISSRRGSARFCLKKQRKSCQTSGKRLSVIWTLSHDPQTSKSRPPLVIKRSINFYSKIVELEEELRVVGNNLKSLEVSEEKVNDLFYARCTTQSERNTYQFRGILSYLCPVSILT